MLLVELFYDRSKISETWLMRKFLRQIQAIVAEELRVETPGRGPTPRLSDVEVKTSAFSELDIHQCDIEIMVNANSYPERLAEIKVRRERILERAKPALEKRFTLSVWLRLADGSYGSCHGAFDECAEAKGCLAMLQRGEKLSFEGEHWLRNHATACEECGALWNKLQPR